MKRLLTTLCLMIFLFLVRGAVSAQNLIKVQGLVERGGKTVTTSGVTSITKVAQTYPSATVTVYYQGGTVIVPLCSDNATPTCTTQANPFTAASDASFSFYVRPGRYSIRYSGTGITTPFTISDILVPLDPTTNAVSLQCAGVDDSTALTAAKVAASGGYVLIGRGQTCAGSDISLTNVQIVPGGLLKSVTAHTITITGVVDGNGQIFTNAISGQGTISFSGNRAVTDFQTAWWGPDATGVVDALAKLKACEAATVSAGGGNILIGHSQYSISGTWIINSAGTIRAVNVIGVSATPTGGSVISYAGATNLPAIKFNINKFARFSQVRVENTVAKGTTAGVFFTGPSSGEQTANIAPDNVLVTGFHVGFDLGDGTAASAQIALQSCYLDGNDLGLRVQNFNSVNINLYNSSLLNNTQYGVQAAVYNLNVFGGSFANNTLGDFNLTPNMGTYFLAGIRTELSTAGSFVVGGNIINLTVQSLLIQSLTVSSAPLILADGVITLRGSTIHPGAPSTAMTIYQSQGNAALGQFTCENNEINSGATLFDPTNGNNANLHYRLMNNQKWADGGATSGRFADEPWGVVVGTAKSSFIGVGAGFASTPGTADQITSSQNNYVLPNTRLVRLNTDASRNITGLTTSPTQVNGQEHFITNIGTQDIVLVNQSASSTAANRLLNATGADITLTANQQAFVWYDSGTARWRCSKLN